MNAISELQNLSRNEIIDKFKSTIKNCDVELTDDEKCIVTNLDFNPHLLLLVKVDGISLHECFSDLTIQRLFLHHRHLKITVIYQTNLVINIPILIKANAINNFFTDNYTSHQYFINRSNGFSVVEHHQAQRIANLIFNVTFKKMAYIRDDTSKFRSINPIVI